ncbi:hypothetical protein L9F63_018266, partial [Diploptera punctata]
FYLPCRRGQFRPAYCSSGFGTVIFLRDRGIKGISRVLVEYTRKRRVGLYKCWDKIFFCSWCIFLEDFAFKIAPKKEVWG